tara:strand:+ start:998 stop:1894 length:897 start_codon:yes stop_codon:yes gene_type:complete
MAATTKFNDNIKNQLNLWFEELKSKGVEDEVAEFLKRELLDKTFKKNLTKIPEPAKRCQARTWVNGASGQCTNEKVASSAVSLCKKCNSKYSKCSTPCSWKDGKKHGLFLGMISEELPILAAEGNSIAVLWTKETSTFEQYHRLWESGIRFHPNTKEGKAGRKSLKLGKTKKSPTKKSTKKATKKRAPSGFNLFMKEKRSIYRDGISEVVENTSKHPTLAVIFLATNAMNIKKSIKEMNDCSTNSSTFTKWLEKVVKIVDDENVKTWTNLCEKYGLENDGDWPSDGFSGRLIMSILHT